MRIDFLRFADNFSYVFGVAKLVLIGGLSALGRVIFTIVCLTFELGYGMNYVALLRFTIVSLERGSWPTSITVMGKLSGLEFILTTPYQNLSEPIRVQNFCLLHNYITFSLIN